MHKMKKPGGWRVRLLKEKEGKTDWHKKGLMDDRRALYMVKINKLNRLEKSPKSQGNEAKQYIWNYLTRR